MEKMTKEEAIKLLRHDGYPSPYIPLTSEQANQIADLLDPPKHPEPETFVEWRPRGLDFAHDAWERGVVSSLYGGVVDSAGMAHSWHEIEYRPVEILRPGEYKVKVPPLEKWGSYHKAWHYHEHSCYLSPSTVPGNLPEFGRHIATVTREEMERREKTEHSERTN